MPSVRRRKKLKLKHINSPKSTIEDIKRFTLKVRKVPWFCSSTANCQVCIALPFLQLWNLSNTKCPYSFIWVSFALKFGWGYVVGVNFQNFWSNNNKFTLWPQSCACQSLILLIPKPNIFMEVMAIGNEVKKNHLWEEVPLKLILSINPFFWPISLPYPISITPSCHISSNLKVACFQGSIRGTWRHKHRLRGLAWSVWW